MNQKHSFREYSNYKVPRQFKKLNNSIDIGSPLPLPYTVRHEDIKRENNDKNNDENRDEIKNDTKNEDDKFIKKDNVEIFDRKKIKFDINKLIKNLESKEKQNLSEDIELKNRNTFLDSNIKDKINTDSNKAKRKLLIEIGEPLPLHYDNINNNSISNSNSNNDLERVKVGMEIRSIRENLLKSQSLNDDKTKIKRHQLDFGDPLPLEYIGKQTSCEGYRLKVFRDMSDGTDEIEETKEDNNRENNKENNEGNNEDNNDDINEEEYKQSDLQEIEKVESYNSYNQIIEDSSEGVKENPIMDIVYMDKLISRVLHVLIISFVLFILLSAVSYYLAD